MGWDAAAGWWPGLATALETSVAVDRVELKAMVAVGMCSEVYAEVLTDDDPVRSARVYFFDTPGLGLRSRGVIVRARRRGGGADVVVKVRRPVSVPTDDGPGGWGARVELDALAGQVWCSTTLGHRVRPSQIRGALSGRTPVRSLLSAGQQALFDHHASGPGVAVGGGRIEVDAVAGAGPIQVTRALVGVPGLARRLVLEDWVYPDASRLVELSTKCRPLRAVDVAGALGRALSGFGLVPDTQRMTKTDASLAFFFAQPAGGPQGFVSDLGGAPRRSG